MASNVDALEAVEKDFRELAVMLGESGDLQRLIYNPLIGRAPQWQALQALGAQAQFNKLTMQFLGVLSHNRRLSHVGGIIMAFQEDLAKKRGQVTATVETAFALTPAQEKNLQEKLSVTMNVPVTMDMRVNKELLGGLIVTVGSRQIDDSVRRKLERLKRSMSAQTISNQKSFASPQKKAS